MLGLWGPNIPLCTHKLNRVSFNNHARWHRIGVAPHVHPLLSVGLCTAVVNYRVCPTRINQDFKEIKLPSANIYNF